MYKWHVHSAIGRGRPTVHEFARVTDGIAASLRSFSISASRSAENDGPSRSQRSAEAFKEVSRLAPQAPKGIDARSLAANPPATFTIRRVQEGSYDKNPARRGPSGPRTARTPGGLGARGGSRIPGRGAFRGGMRGSGRGGRGGPGIASRGRGAGAGRKRERRGGKRGPADQQDLDAFTTSPYTAEEAEALVSIHGGYPTAWKPTTSMETLAGWMPPVGSNASGLVDTAVYKIAVATGNVNPDIKMGYDHLKKTRNGTGTLFENNEQRAALEGFEGPLRRDLGKDLGYFPDKLGKLTPAQKKDLSRQWIAGQYEKPKSVDVGDVLGQVRSHALRNETYLAENGRELVGDLESRIPKADVRKTA